MSKMGSMSKILGMMPGMGNMKQMVGQVDVFVIRPWFKISRRFPFIINNRNDLALKEVESTNVDLKLIRYFPFPKDSILSHISLAISIFLNKNKFSTKMGLLSKTTTKHLFKINRKICS